MFILPSSKSAVQKLLDNGTKLPLATKNYPSRGQTSVQELYQTKIGKLFLKRSSERNHTECQIKIESGTLAQREYWAFSLARKLDLQVPSLTLLDRFTTVQVWLDLPDAHLYKMSKGVMAFEQENVFNCALFDWLTGQVDRHDANYLYDFVNKRIVPIDSAHGFLKYEGSLPDYLHLYEIGDSDKLSINIVSKFHGKLKKIKNSELIKLAPLKDKNERDAFLIRKEQLDKVKTIQDILNLYRSV